jgi:hypothetical protein
LDGEDVARLLRDDAALALWHGLGKPVKTLRGKEAKLVEAILNADWQRKHG